MKMNNFDCIFDNDLSDCTSDNCEECSYYRCRFCVCVSNEQCKNCLKDSSCIKKDSLSSDFSDFVDWLNCKLRKVRRYGII